MIAETTHNGSESEKPSKPQEIQKLIDLKALEQRRIALWGPVDDDSSKEIVGKLLYLESIKPGEKITFFINSPGGIRFRYFGHDELDFLAGRYRLHGYCGIDGIAAFISRTKRGTIYFSARRSNGSSAQHRIAARLFRRPGNSCAANFENKKNYSRNSIEELQSTYRSCPERYRERFLDGCKRIDLLRNRRQDL
jgi:Clp protease